jgi:hypothetical protein
MKLCFRKGHKALVRVGVKWQPVRLDKTLCGRFLGTAFIRGGAASQVPVGAVARISVRGKEYAAAGSTLKLLRKP